MISMACYCLLFPVVFAYYLSIYSSTDYLNKKNPEPRLIVENKYEFVYHLEEKLMMDIRLKNKAPNVTATIFLTSWSSNQTGVTALQNMTECKDEDCTVISSTFKSPFMSIGMQLYRGTVMCATHFISKGNETLSNTTSKLWNLCVKQRCVMVIDLLQNKCGKDFTDLQDQQQSTMTPSQNNVFIYVISSVVVMCIVALVIYLSFKKFRTRKSDPEETLELNTYATRNEVLYADLSLVQGNNQPPRHDEESPYAQIVGVLHPKK